MPALAQEIGLYKRAGIPLHIVALNPARDDLGFFRHLLPSTSFVRYTDLSPHRATTERSRAAAAFPIDLAAVGLVALLLLAANEYFCSRLSWGRVGRREVTA
jgi:hypothetical protein